MRNAEIHQCGPYFFDRFSLRIFIAYNSAFADVFPPRLELGLYKNNDLSPIALARRLGKTGGNYTRENECCRDERYIDGDEVYEPVESFVFKEARVGFLEQAYAWVLPELEIQLTVAGIDGDDPSRAMLQQAIGESSSRCADIEANFARNMNFPVIEGAFEFQAATAYVAEILAEQADRGVFLNRCPGFFQLLIINQNFAGKNQSLRAFARSGQSTIHEQFIETDFHCDCAKNSDHRGDTESTENARLRD